MSELQLDPATASRRAGFAPTFLRDILQGRKRSVRASSATRLARVLGTSVEWLLEGRGEETPNANCPCPQPAIIGGVELPEIAGRDLHWIMSREALEGLRIRTEAQLAILEVSTDLMAPTLQPGDMLLIDKADQKPPGIFAISDGETIVAKRIERLPGPPGEPARLRISADSPIAADQDVDASWVDIIGRVVGLIRRV